MNASKLNPFKRDEQSSRCRSSQVLNNKWCAINQCTCVSKNSRSLFLFFFQRVLWLNDTSYSKSVWTDKLEHTG